MQKQNDEKRPIAHASKTLSSTQQHYLQIKRKVLSIIYGVKKQYLYGRKFTSPRPCLNWRAPAELLHGQQPKCLLLLFLLHEK